MPLIQLYVKIDDHSPDLCDNWYPFMNGSECTLFNAELIKGKDNDEVEYCNRCEQCKIML